MLAGIKVERIADVGSMQMTAKDHLYLEIFKALHRSLGLLHHAVAEIVRGRCKVMMGDHNANRIRRRAAEDFFAIIQLRLQDPAVADRRVRGRGIQSGDDSTLNAQYGVQIRRNNFAVQPMGIHHSFGESIQRDIVIARNDKAWYIRQLCQKGFRSFKLVSFGSLRQIATDNNGVGIQLWRDPQHGFTNLWDVRRTKVQIGDLQ